MNRALVIGALGQVGTELGEELIKEKGAENVVATDVDEVVVRMNQGDFIRQLFFLNSLMTT